MGSRWNCPAVSGKFIQQVQSVADFAPRIPDRRGISPDSDRSPRYNFSAHRYYCSRKPSPRTSTPPCVGMVDQVCEDLAGVFLVVSHLGASVRMGERGDGFDRAGDERPGLPLDGCSNVVDASHGGDDPKLIAHGRPSVRSSEAPEEPLSEGAGSVTFRS